MKQEATSEIRRTGMTIAPQPTDQDREQYQSWVDTRPEPVKSMAARLFPWQLYRHDTTGQLVYVTSFNEDGTVTMRVVGHSDKAMDSMHIMDFGVFGVDPNQLHPCNPPTERWL